MKKYFLAFATKNWNNAITRISKQMDYIQSNYHYFDNVFLYNEDNLESDFMDLFKDNLHDPGVAYWAWKPYLILKVLNKLNNNDCLYYFDMGCSLFNTDQQALQFLAALNLLTSELDHYQMPIGIGESPYWNGNCGVQIKTEILKEFNLENNIFFNMFFPHYEAGILILKKNEKTVKLITDWYQFFVQNYKTHIIYPSIDRHDKTNQKSYFISNNSDQSILQCLLYTYNMTFCNMKDIFYQLKVYERIRG